MTNIPRLLMISSLIMLAGINAFSQPEPQSVLDFPDVDGWTKTDVTHYPMAELGYSVTYASNIGGSVTVYIYDGGNRSIPDGIKSKVVKSEIQKAKREILAAVELGYYEKAETLTEDSIVLGGDDGSVDILRIVLDLTTGGRDLTSEIYLFGMDNNFVKFRATRAKEIEGLLNKAVVDLFAALDKYFASSPKPVVSVPGPSKSAKPVIKKKIDN